MRLRAAQLAALGSFATAFACNAITGVSSLEEAAFVDAGLDRTLDVQPSPQPTTTGTSTSTAPQPPLPPPVEAGVDATIDAPADAPPDTFVPPPGCESGSSGPLYGTVVLATDVGGGPRWSGEDGAAKPGDGSVAHTNGGAANPNTLTIRSFGFAIPRGAMIKGIKLDAARTAIGNVGDKAITLLKGAPKTNGAWPEGSHEGPFVTTTYGGPTDLWGTTWTVDDVNSSAFAVNVLTQGDGDGHLDGMGITVYYCATK